MKCKLCKKKVGWFEGTTCIDCGVKQASILLWEEERKEANIAKEISRR